MSRPSLPSWMAMVLSIILCACLAAWQALAAEHAAADTAAVPLVAADRDDEALSLMQVGVSTEPKKVKRRTGRKAVPEEEEDCEADFEEDGAVLMQSSVRKATLSQRWEELDFDDASL
uniref:Transmembrane protein n=1 Tax=Pyrodinium bahamense TaxID=73915 RepID=A0A7S0FJ05_9DINO|mmetsp:Transcript_34347/g.94924  ORF Transcript_34347/g.94924 Transcript_34347/m.94924 type:complete len:118 (+) Transcript_34347:98-451(+)